jgi:hypothetical protein
MNSVTKSSSPSLQYFDLESFSYLLSILDEMQNKVCAVISTEGEILLNNPYGRNSTTGILKRLKTSESFEYDRFNLTFQPRKDSPPIDILAFCPKSITCVRMADEPLIQIEGYGEQYLYAPACGRIPPEDELQLWSLGVRPNLVKFARQAISDFYGNIPF